jgi:DNA polymerase III delta' subunit
MPLAELVGQDLARERLLRLAQSGRVPSTLLFTGPPGVGKALAARAFVQRLNCRRPVDDDACGSCPTCIQIARGRFPDLFRVLPDGIQIKIEQVSAIQEFIGFAPLTGAYRTVIIEEAHRLNGSAANALLKTLEEPPEQVLFILLTHRHNLLPETVLSRCLLLPFAFLKSSEVARILKQRPVPESAELDEAALETAAAWSGGSLERALFFLDPDNLQWGREFISAFAALPGAGPARALDLAQEAAGREDREVVFYLLKLFLHQALLASRGSEDAEGGGFPAVWEDEIGRFAGLGPERLLQWHRRLLTVEEGQRVNLNLQLAFEAFFLTVAGRPGRNQAPGD